MLSDAAFCYDCNYAMSEAVFVTQEEAIRVSLDPSVYTESCTEEDEDYSCTEQNLVDIAVAAEESDTTKNPRGEGTSVCSACQAPTQTGSKFCSLCEISTSADKRDSVKPRIEPSELSASRKLNIEEVIEIDSSPPMAAAPLSSARKRKLDFGQDGEVVEVASFSPTKLVQQRFQAAEEKGEMICLLHEDSDEEEEEQTSDDEIEFLSVVPANGKAVKDPKYPPVISAEDLETIFETV